MHYDEWLASFQSSENAAKSAFDEVVHLRAQVEQFRQISAEFLSSCEGLSMNDAILRAKGLAHGNIEMQEAANFLAYVINKTSAE